ncbi:hypothetical protein CcCBS67573_g00075 [Chytriomyces confervae]|uniref:SAM domain-containing protein n=1 Tax=Chytriomyces confervae TaxID=246404 RepID=A0A507FW07_9FUNG|nr:hypothetical protein CcCBS67573_g00075 [Chytriomyces confervae]
MSLERFEIIGRGNNLTDAGHISVEAGWDVETTLNAAVLLKLSDKLKNVRIQAEFRGYCETRWDSPGKPATKTDTGDTHKVTRYGRVFQQLVTVVYESSSPILPNPVGGSNAFEFHFVLPKSQMPPSFESPSGSIQYHIKCTMLYQEGMRLLKSSCDFETPVQVFMPEAAKLKMLAAPSQMFQQADQVSDKVSYSVDIQRRILSIGQTLEVDVTVLSTPNTAKLRSINASLRSAISYMNPDHSMAVQTKFPRPLSEISMDFPNIQVGATAAAPIYRRLYLTVDPLLAQASLESPFISIKTLLRLQFLLDDSEVPNVQYDVPVVVVPKTRAQIAEEEQEIAANLALQEKEAQERRLASAATTTTHDTTTTTRVYQSTAVRSASLSSNLSHGSHPSSGTLSSHRRALSSSHRVPRTEIIVPASGTTRTRQPSLSSLPSPAMSPMQISSSNDSRFALTQSKSVPSLSHRTSKKEVNGMDLSRSSSSRRQDKNNNTFSYMLNELEAMELSLDYYPDKQPSLPPPVTNSYESLAQQGKSSSIQSSPSLRAAAPVDILTSRSRSGGSRVLHELSEYGPVGGWSNTVVCDALKRLGGSVTVVQSFSDNQIDGSVLVSLSEEDLKTELGVNEAGLRRKIMNLIQQQGRVVHSE